MPSAGLGIPYPLEQLSIRIYFNIYLLIVKRGHYDAVSTSASVYTERRLKCNAKQQSERPNSLLDEADVINEVHKR